MKKKYLKKMLAIMLASMTVSATPGLVGAMKEESKKSIQEANSKIANHTLTIEAATNMLDKFEKMAQEDDEAKKEVANTLTKMIDQGLFDQRVKTRKRTFDGVRIVSTIKPPSDETISKIIDILNHCLDCDAAKGNVAKSIQNMAEDKWLSATSAIEILTKCLEYGNDKTEQENYSETKKYVAKAIDAILKIKDISDDSDPFYIAYIPPDDVSKIMHLLKNVLKDNETIVASAISSLIEASSEDYLNTNEILNMLDESVKDDKAKVYVAKSIISMSKRQFFERNFQQERILNMLQACLGSDRAQKYVADALCPDQGRQNLCDKDSFDQCLNMLETCSKNDDAKSKVASAIYNMTFSDLLNKNSRDKVLNILRKCSEKSGDIYSTVGAMSRMIKKGLLNEKPMNEDMLCIIESGSSEKNTIYAIGDMVDKDLLNQCQNDEITRIVDSLVYCIDQNSHNISAHDDLKVVICQTIATMAAKNILNRCPKAQMNELVMRLIRIFNPYGNLKAIEAISAMNEKNLISELDSYYLQLLIDSLINRFNYDGAAISTTLAAIIRNNDVLGKLDPARLQQLANLLPGMLANDNTQEAATIIISAMAENPNIFNHFNQAQLRNMLNLFKTHLENYLASGNYEMADRVFKVLRRCSEIDDLKADVAGIFENLADKDNFHRYLNHDPAALRLGNFFDISTSCSRTQNVEAQQKAVYTTLAVIRYIGSSIYQTEETNAIVRDKLPEIINMLERLSTASSYDIIYDVSVTINLLGKRGFCNGLTNEQNGRLITILNNCLTFNNMQIPDEINISDDHKRIITNVYSIFNEKTWIEEFREGLSDEDRARLDQLEQNAKSSVETENPFS